MSLSDIKKVTVAFKPSLNKVFHVDEAFVVPGKAVVSEAVVTEMAMTSIYDEADPKKVLTDKASETEAEAVAFKRRLSKGIAGDASQLHSPNLYRHWKGGKTNWHNDPVAALEQLKKDADGVKNAAINPGNKFREHHGTSHARLIQHHIPAIEKMIPEFVAKKKATPAPAPEAKPVAKAAAAAAYVAPKVDAPNF